MFQKIFETIYKIPNQFFLRSKIVTNKNNKNQIESDQVKFSSTDDEFVRSYNNSVNSENSKLNNLYR